MGCDGQGLAHRSHRRLLGSLDGALRSPESLQNVAAECSVEWVVHASGRAGDVDRQLPVTDAVE